jgi:hypothetical protein
MIGLTILTFARVILVMALYASKEASYHLHSIARRHACPAVGTTADELSLRLVPQHFRIAQGAGKELGLLRHRAMVAARRGQPEGVMPWTCNPRSQVRFRGPG